MLKLGVVLMLLEMLLLSLLDLLLLLLVMRVRVGFDNLDTQFS
jgi:hypothetical protein